MSYRSLLRHRVTIERNTPANTDGEIRGSWADDETDVPCLIQEGRGRVKMTHGGEGLEVDAVGFFLPSQDIRPRVDSDRKDRITVTKPSSPGGTFLVEFVEDQAGQDHHLLAYLTRVPSS